MERFWRTGIVCTVVMMSGVGGVGADQLLLPIPATPWVIETADYTGDVKEQIARLQGRYTIRTMRDGWTEIPLTIQHATITAIEIKRKTGEAHIVPRGGSYVLVATRKGTYEVHVKFSRLLVQENQVEALRFGVPQATFSTMTLFVPRKDVELRQADQLYVEREPDAGRAGVRLIARLGAADYVDLGWNTRPAAPEKLDPMVYGEVNTLVTLEDQLARLSTIILYRMAQGETKELRVTVPARVSILNIRGAGIEDWKIADTGDHKTLTVTLARPLKDTTYRLILEGEETREGSSATYQLPEIALVGAKQERGYIAVARAGNIEVTAKDATGVTRIDTRELPQLLTASTASPAVLAFRYHQHPYQIAVGVTRHQDHAVLAAIAEQAELTTVLSRQGDLLTRAAYLIKSNKKQFLEVRLPEDATLWSCLVGGTSVKPVEGTDGVLLVPLTATHEASQAVPVEIVYMERRPKFQGMGSFHLEGPKLDVPSTIANWVLYAPREVRFLRMGGNVERGAAAFAFLDEPFIQTAAAAEQKAEYVGQLKNQFSASFAMRRMANKEAKLHQDRYQAQSGVRGAASESELGFEGDDPQTLAPVSADRLDGEVTDWIGRANETGILPLKIQLPKSGQVLRFNRLMTTKDSLKLDGTFVHLRWSWIVFAGFGLLVVPLGGVALIRAKGR